MLSSESLVSDSFSMSGSQAGCTPKQKPYTSFIDTANRRRTQLPNELKSDMTENDNSHLTDLNVKSQIVNHNGISKIPKSQVHIFNTLKGVMSQNPSQDKIKLESECV